MFGSFLCRDEFIGSIGRIMLGFGFREILEFIYVLNVVSYMLSGKVVFCVVWVMMFLDIVM